MQYLDRDQLRVAINTLGASGNPFLFLIDYKGERGVVASIDQLAELGIYCSINDVELGKTVDTDCAAPRFEIIPPSFEQYLSSFEEVKAAIAHGDTYLLNLTSATSLRGSLNFRSIYQNARAHYKFMIEDQILFYSPEPFIRIEQGKIYSFPMKGTIDATEADAERMLIESKKELCEHYTIVDLIRNDLSIVAQRVEVERFRYVEKIKTATREILQTSSLISGSIGDDWASRLGDILLSLLPAGSICGAPKERTLEIIDRVESSPRGFYTGVMGVFADGKVDSCVNIRYLERTPDGSCLYRSGGGITSMSDVRDEYNELITKIYVPIA